MIFHQFFDQESCTYTYFLAQEGMAILIDPVFSQVAVYMDFLKASECALVYALDTHLHADHITGTGRLREETGCRIGMSLHTKAQGVTDLFDDRDVICVKDMHLTVRYTPGHTTDSVCYVMADRVFTGDTLLINATGRTDFQNGDPRVLYRSIVDKLLTLPPETLVFPGHDYKGNTVSTIAQEREQNPRLQVSSEEEFADIMNRLNLEKPKQFDIAVPKNQFCGLQKG